MPTLQEIQADAENKRLAKKTPPVSPNSPTLPTQAIPLPNATPSTTPTMGIVPKAPIAQPEIKEPTTLSQFNQATQGQDVQFRQTYRDSLGTVTLDGQSILKPDGTLAPNATTTPTTTPNTPTGLSGAELQAYNQLSPVEQETYQKLATQGVKAQTDYLTKAKANMEFSQSQQDTKMKIQSNENAIYEIQSQENIAQARKSLDNLKQNIGFIGTGGQPGKSMAKMDAISNQVATAEKTYNNILEVDRLTKENRALGQEANVEIFSRQMKLLQDDLDSKVSKSIQGALNEFNSAELEGRLDTIPEIEAFQQQLYTQLDGDLSSIMDTNIEARKFLIERYDKLAESQKAQMANTEKAKADYQKNANTLNKDMSDALGYFVNNNGEPLVDKTTGQQIAVPPETTTNYDASTGQMILMTKNRDGSIGVQIKQVGSGQAKAPQTTTIENPDGTKTTMQWTGSQWTPIQGSQASGTGVTPTGTLSTATVNGKNIQLDSIASQALNSVVPLLGSGVILGEGHRTRERQAQLYEAYKNGTGGLAAPPGQSKHESGMAIDIYSGKDKNGKLLALTPEQVKIMNANGWVQNAGADDMGHFEYVGTASTGAKSTLADSNSTKVINITRQAFGRNPSDGEREEVKKLLKEFPNATVKEIGLAIRGLNVPPEKADTTMSFIRVMDKLKKPPEGFEATIGNYINRDDMKGLNNYIQKHVENDVKSTTPADQFISTPEQNKITKNIDEVIKLINANKDKIGAVDGRYTQLAKKFQSEPDIQKLQTLMTGTFADLRKKFAGSAVTATELTALEDFIAGSTTEVPENLITKLQTLKDVQTGLYNDQRSSYGVPNVKTLEAKKKLGGFSLTDILSKLK